MKHSKIVGGSTAKRVMMCPGSVALCAKMPPSPSSSYADEGTLLHDAIAMKLETLKPVRAYLGMTYEKQVLTEELIDTKLQPALDALDEIDPNQAMVYEVETSVGFGDLLPGVFGSTDLIGRIGNRAVVLDWKFGYGVAVDAEENQQLMFYAAAAMRTPSASWAFAGATEIELIIVQPPSIKRWVTTRERIAEFERDLVKAVAASQLPDAKLQQGDHCKFCPARPVCPIMTGAVDRALKVKMDGLPADMVSKYLANADLLEGWISSIRALAFDMLEKGVTVPGYKLVNKSANRSWADESTIKGDLLALGLKESEVVVTKLVSPAQAEIKLKKFKLSLPEGSTVAISSGTTFAPESDKRPAVVQIGKQLTAALAKLQ